MENDALELRRYFATGFQVERHQARPYVKANKRVRFYFRKSLADRLWIGRISFEKLCIIRSHEDTEVIRVKELTNNVN